MAGAAIWNQIPPALEAGQTAAQRSAYSRYSEQPLHRVLLRMARGRIVHRPLAHTGPCRRESAPPAPPATAASPFLWKPLSPHQGSPDEPVHASASRVRRTKAWSKRAAILGLAPWQRTTARDAPRVAMTADGMDSMPPMAASDLGDFLRIMSVSIQGHALFSGTRFTSPASRAKSGR